MAGEGPGTDGDGRRLRVLVTSVGSSGDIHPFVAIALALRERGHEVTVLVNPYFESTVRGAGLAYRALGTYVSPTDVARDVPEAFGRFGGTVAVVRKLFVPSFEEAYPSLREAFEAVRPDVVVGHQISFGLGWLAREFGARWVTCVLSPSTLLSSEDPSVYPSGLDVRRAPMWVRRMYSFSARRVMGVILDPPMNRVRRGLGVPEGRDIFFAEMLGADRVLAMFSPVLRGPARDDPATMRICGFPWFERHGHHGALAHGLSAELERFLADGEPPIVFSLGSVLSHTQGQTFAAALEAARTVGRRAVLVTGHDHGGGLALGDDAIRVDYAPYSLLMARAAVNVHHGGIGTTAQALRAGRPMVVLAHAHDQFDNAARVARLGVGVRLSAGRRARARRLAGALERALGDETMRKEATRVGAIVTREDGAAVAAEEIERLGLEGREPAVGMGVEGGGP